jgi:hypothetical protein
MVTRQAPIYLDSDMAADGDGLTPATAKKYLGSAYNAAAASGGVVLMRRDRFYSNQTGGYHPVIRKQYFTLGTYGEGPPPVIDSFNWEMPGSPLAAGWALESPGSGIWSKTYPANAVAKRLFVGGYNNGNRYALRNPGVAMRKIRAIASATFANIKAAMGPADIWYAPKDAIASPKVYVYTGSDTIGPVEKYNGLCWNMTNGTTGVEGTARIGISGPAVQVQSSIDVLVMGVESWGCDVHSFTATSNTTDPLPCKNIVFKNCTARYMYSGGLKAMPVPENSLTPRVEISDILFEDCYCDSGSSPQEQEPTTAYGWLAGGMDMMVAYDKVKNVLFRRCTSVNSWHVAFVMGVYGFNSQKSDNCGFENCYAYWDEYMSYARGASTNRCMPNCFIRNCVFDGQNVRSQFVGSAVVSGNLWINNRIAARKPDVSGWMYTGAELLERTGYTNVGRERFIYVVPEDLWVVNNIVVDPVGVPIVIENFVLYNKTDPENTGQLLPEPVIAENTVNILNNVIYDRASKEAEGVLESVSIVERILPIGRQNIHNNVVYGGTSKPAPLLGKWNNAGQVMYTPLNESEHCLGTNLFVDPLIDWTDKFNPKMAKNSPCRRAGKVTRKPLRDMRGRPFMVPPTIGALEYTGGSYRS